MSTENPENSNVESQSQEKPAIPVVNPEKQEELTTPKISSQKLYISQDSTDQIKNMFQPLKDEISTIDRLYEGSVSIPTEEEKIIIKEEIPGEKIKTTTKTTTVTTRTIKIVNGKEVSSTENVTTTVEKNQEKINGEKPIIKEIIINKEETNNNINNKEKNDSINMIQSNVTFGAPDNINNYNSILTSSNVTFGFNNNNKVNLNNENNNNNSNISDSVDKSSEQGNNIVIEINKEINEENKNEKEPQIKFGFKPNNLVVEQKELKLDDNNVKFGFNKNNNDNKEMEIEPGEIKDEEKKEEIKEKTEVKEEKEENKVPIFTGSLFNNDKNNNSNNQGQSSIFDQKLFQNKIEDNNINININLLPENKINSIFENTQNAQETFLKNNISLMNNNSNNNNTEQPSPIFNINIQNNSEINPETLKTLNDKIKEGDIYNADSAKKTQTNPNLNIFSTLNTNISNENAPIPIPSTNKGKNPFKPDEQQNINTTSNNNDNNIDTNDNLDTNETTINRGINININNNNNTKLSSPFASLGNKDKSAWFISPNKQAEEISVNPVFTGNPFSTVLDINKNKEQKIEDKSYKSSLFPGLEKADMKGNNIIEEEKKSNPPFPGINNNQININTKSNLFVDDNKEKDNEKNKEEEKESPFLSEIISIGIPKINEDNKENISKEINEENKDNNPINNNLPQLKDIIQSKGNNEKEKLPESINQENKEEKNININISLNKPEEIPSENKENELIMSDILNSNLTQDNQNNNNNNISQLFNKSLFENINKENKNEENKENQNKSEIQPQTSQRKSLFGDLFLNKNDTNLNDLLMKNSKSSGFMTGNKDENEPLFGTKDLNNINSSNNLFENNQGKNILNSSAGLTLFGKEMTPIKSTNLTQTKIEEKENKENKEENQEREKESDSEVSIRNNEEEKDQKENEKEKEPTIIIKEIKEREIEENEIPKEENNINIIINNSNGSNEINNKPETNFAEEEINIEITLSDEENEDNNSSNIKQKPLNRKIYSELIKKIYRITEKKKDDISFPEKKTVTIYDNILSQFLSDFEEKIKNLKNCYINTLIKRQLEKDPNKRIAIILEANLPKKRNEVKKVYKNMSNIIDNKLDNENKKYYYIEILKILQKYDVITDTEIKDDMKIYKINLKKQKNKQENKNDKIIKEKNVKQNKKGSYNIVNVAIFLIPLIYAGYFTLTNLK